MKKILIWIISLLTVLIFFCTGCGSYVQNGSSSGSDDQTTILPKPDDKVPQEEKFTVELKHGGSKYVPPFIPGKPVKARWTALDGSSIHEAKFNDDGIAEVEGLDGDYRVTLVDLPSNVTYDPQGYTADNYNKHTVIEILTISRTTHSTGSGLSKERITTISVSTSNSAGSTYRAVIDSAWNGALSQYAESEGIVFYQIAPTQPGWYSVESWVDISSNEVNPILEYYFGTTDFKSWDRRIDSGGSASTYSKNFRFEIQLTQEYVGNIWAFGVHAESKKGTYPVKIDFTIKYEGTFDPATPDFTVVKPKGPYAENSQNPTGTFRYNYYDTNNKLLMGSRFKLNPDDRFYHLYDEVKYAESDGYGPVLYAKITKGSEVLSTNNGFLEPPSQSSAGVNLKIEYRNPFNYNEFIYKDYTNFIQKYATYCNSDGVHPVNEELKRFLQEWAIANEYFHDGDGWAEKKLELKSSYEDQWLFACGYYM